MQSYNWKVLCLHDCLKYSDQSDVYCEDGCLHQVSVSGQIALILPSQSDPSGAGAFLIPGVNQDFENLLVKGTSNAISSLFKGGGVPGSLGRSI